MLSYHEHTGTSSARYARWDCLFVGADCLTHLLMVAGGGAAVSLNPPDAATAGFSNAPRTLDFSLPTTKITLKNVPA